MLDWARIAELKQEIGAEDFGEVVELFLEEVEAEIGALRAGADPAGMEEKFHLLKGAALNLGFKSFAQECETAERAAAKSLHAQIDIAAALAAYDMSRAEFLAGLAGRAG